MRRKLRSVALFSSVLALFVLLLLPEAALANSVTTKQKVRTVDSNHTKTYYVDYTNEIDCNSYQFEIRIDVSFGTITATSAVVKTVKYTYIFYSSGGVFGDGGSIWDDYGHTLNFNGDVGHIYPTDGTTYTVSVYRTFNFTQTLPITFYKQDQIPGICDWNTYLQIGFNPVNPT